MANRSYKERNIRSLNRTAGGSYYVTLPIEFVKELKWQSKQKLQMTLKDGCITIYDND